MEARRVSPQRRSWISVVLALVSLGMVVSGVLSFVLPYSVTLSGIHTWFGFAFLLLIGLHLLNNSRALLGYLRSKHSGRRMLTGTFISLVMVLGVLIGVPPFSSLIELGHQLKHTKGLGEGSYQTITTRVMQSGLGIQIELRAGPHYQSPPQPLFLGLTYHSTPQVAIWIEDLKGNYLETLYVTAKLATSNFRLASFSNTAKQRRPEALPYWAHKRDVIAIDGLRAPTAEQNDLDGVTAATPLGHYDVRSVVGRVEREEAFRVLLEVNRSYDFNDYYSPNRFPDDPVYSGNGSSGQPSVVYAATVTPGESRQHYLLKPIGHGHHSGRDGKLYQDMSGIDTALKLLERVVVSVDAVGK